MTTDQIAARLKRLEAREAVERWIPFASVAELLHVSRSTLAKLVREHDIPTARPGRVRLISRSAYADLCERIHESTPALNEQWRRPDF